MEDKKILKSHLNYRTNVLLKLVDKPNLDNITEVDVFFNDLKSNLKHLKKLIKKI